MDSYFDFAQRMDVSEEVNDVCHLIPQSFSGISVENLGRHFAVDALLNINRRRKSTTDILKHELQQQQEIIVRNVSFELHRLNELENNCPA